MAFSLYPGGMEDVEDFAKIFSSAFKNDSIMGHFYPDTPAQVKQEKDVKFFSDLMAQGDIFGGRFTKVVEKESGRTVAFSRWTYPCSLTAEQKNEREAKEKERFEGPPVEGSNKVLLDDFRKQMQQGRKKWLDPEKTYFLHILAVDPAYQRRGLGSMLIRPGLEAADKAGAQTYIEASAAGLPLYLKHGWEPVDGLSIDMRLHGGHAVEKQTFLMREANAPNKLGKKLE